MEIIVLWLAGVAVNAAAVYLTARLLPGVSIDRFSSAFWVALVLATIGALLKWTLVVITFPVLLITLGLFYFVIYAIVLKLAEALVKGFVIGGFGKALLMAVVLTIINWLLFGLIPGL